MHSLNLLLDNLSVEGGDFWFLKCSPALKYSPSSHLHPPATVLIDNSHHCLSGQFLLQTHKVELVKSCLRLSDDFQQCWVMPWQHMNVKDGVTGWGRRGGVETEERAGVYGKQPLLSFEILD